MGAGSAKTRHPQHPDVGLAGYLSTTKLVTPLPGEPEISVGHVFGAIGAQAIRRSRSTSNCPVAGAEWQQVFIQEVT